MNGYVGSSYAYDSIAICKASHPSSFDKLPPGYIIAFDCAYPITDHLVASYSGAQSYAKHCDTSIVIYHSCI